MSARREGALVHVVEDGEGFAPTSLGALAEAARLAPALGGGVAALVAGGDGLEDERCAALGVHGASRVFRVGTRDGAGGPVVDAMAHLMRARGFSHAFLGGGATSIDVGAGLAARLDGGLCVEVTGLGVDADHGLVARRPVLGGVEEVESAFSGPFAVVVARRHAFEPRPVADRPPAPVEHLEVPPSPATRRARLVERTEHAGPVPLEEAEVLVAGGRGLGGPEGFVTVKELADLLGGEVAATRAAVDAGWVPYEAQVGRTGKTVAPRLYLAVGVAGAIQQKAGMQQARHIVAVNRDPDAPIFGFADFGVVGDLNEILPRLVAALRASGAG